MPAPTSTESLDLPGVPLHGFRGHEPVASLIRPRGLTVAISRQAGARGTSIARKVAEILAWQVFDHDTLDYLAQDDTAREQLLVDVPADARQWADAQLARLQHERGLNIDANTLKLVRLVLLVAARGNAVIVGRAAGFLLPHETTIHVRIVAPLDSRIAYMAQWMRLTHPEAAEEVRARDEQRARFLDRTLVFDPADLTAYDVVVNSDRLGVEGAAQFIGWAVRTKQMFVEIAQSPTPPALDSLDQLAS